jgi:peptidyl-tRNA hydrolase, PTH1 family
MLLIAGLGNPGERYASNRHNIGFRVVDAIHRHHGFAPWRRRFQAEISEGAFGDDKVLLLKPQTYMNESGRAVGEAARFYKLTPANVLVIHDELDLNPGKIRLKTGGGSGGHGGLKSISAHIGEAYQRLRIGIGHPGAKELVNPYVLHDFSGEDRTWVLPLIDAIVDNAVLLAEGKDQTFANRVHLAMTPGDKAPGDKAKDVRKDSQAPRKAAITGEADTAEATPRGPLARGLSRLFGGGRS